MGVNAVFGGSYFRVHSFRSKKAQDSMMLTGINLYGWMSILGTIVLLPFSLFMEGGQLSCVFLSLSLSLSHDQCSSPLQSLFDHPWQAGLS